MKEENNNVQLDYNETTFWGLMKIAGIKEFFNWSLIWSIIISVFFAILIKSFGTTELKYNEFAKDITSYLLGSSAGIFSIVIAALSVTLVLFRESLLPILLQEKLLHKFLFPFWYAVVLWCINIINCIFLYTIQALNLLLAIKCDIFIEIFLFLYAMFYTVGLTGLVIRLALQKAQK